MSHNTSHFLPGDAELAAIETAAAEWLIRRDRGLTAAEERELARWLGVDRRRAVVFEALAETWQLMTEVAPAIRLETGPERARKSRWFPVALAAAAAVAMGILGWWRLAGGGGSGAAGAFAMSAATGVGVLRTVELPDGSVIRLNTDSAVDVRFSSAERRVRLSRGEAHFTVARRDRQPFIVRAAGVDVRVVGTVFNVRLRSESVDVLVTEGKVQVGTAATSASGEAGMPPADALSELTAGQRVSIVLPAGAAPVAAAAIAVPPAGIRQALAWQSRRLDFDSTPLADIVAEINRYNRHQLVIADSRLNPQRFGGSFPAGEYDTFVRLLVDNFSVAAERRGEETILRLKNP